MNNISGSSIAGENLEKESLDPESENISEPGLSPECCILFATADWDEPYWTNKQHCAKSLSEIGTRVLYIESVGFRSPRAGSKKDWRRLANRLFKGLSSFFFGAVERAPGIFILSPLVIPAGFYHPVWRRLNMTLLSFMLKRSSRALAFRNPLVWTYHPLMLDVMDDYHGELIYHCVDDIAAVPGVDAVAYRAAEIRLLKRASSVFATSPALAERCRELNSNTFYMPNVVDFEHFSRAFDAGDVPPDMAAIPEPRIGYHGVLSDFKIDFQLMLNVARMVPTWQWVIIGEEREGQNSDLFAELKTLSNVHVLGYRSYASLPDYLRGMQVGLLPSLINEYSRSMFPMKFYEYLASGVPVVSTPLDFTKGLRGPLETGKNPEEFAKAIQKQLGEGRLSQNEAMVFVGDNTWSDRLNKMLSKLKFAA